MYNLYRYYPLFSGRKGERENMKIHIGKKKFSSNKQSPFPLRPATRFFVFFFLVEPPLLIVLQKKRVPTERFSHKLERLSNERKG